MSRTLPYRPAPLRISTHYAHGTYQIHQISPNRFGKAIRRNSAPVRQGLKELIDKRTFERMVRHTDGRASQRRMNERANKRIDKHGI